MKLGIYAIRDNLAVQVSGPRLCVNDKVAEREFVNTVKVNTKDYDLIKLGEYDNETGIILAAKSPIIIVSGVSIAAKGDE